MKKGGRGRERRRGTAQAVPPQPLVSPIIVLFGRRREKEGGREKGRGRRKGKSKGRKRKR